MSGSDPELFVRLLSGLRYPLHIGGWSHMKFDTPKEKRFMSATPPLPNTHDDSRGLTVRERIRILAAQGLKPRDISSMLNIHPQMVLLLLDAPEVTR